MSSEYLEQFLETIEAEVEIEPSGMEFEMAYQMRIAIGRIRFGIKAEQFGPQTELLCAAAPNSSMRFSNLRQLIVCSSGDSEPRYRSRSENRLALATRSPRKGYGLRIRSTKATECNSIPFSASTEAKALCIR